jgi:hypothetical protein
MPATIRGKVPEMIILTKKDWQAVLDAGAEILWETKLMKIFRMPDGQTWRVMPKWGRAWTFEII